MREVKEYISCPERHIQSQKKIGKSEGAVRLFIDGISADAETVKNAVRETGVYMADFITDAAGRVSEIHYNKLS